MSPDVARTTLRQELTMTAGFPDDLFSEDLSYMTSPDWVRSILGQAIRPSGGLFTYSNRSAHLLSAILVQATGGSVLDYARVHLFDPLGIVNRPAFEPSFLPENEAAFAAATFAWPVDPRGDTREPVGSSCARWIWPRSGSSISMGTLGGAAGHSR
jgi:CubicO group peptidase (beta-lactamase class C family)